MPRRRTLPTALTTAAAITALTLAGCSSSPTGDGTTSSSSTGENSSQGQSSAVYDFPLNGMESVGKGEQLTVVLPDDLKQAAGEEASSVVVKSFTVSSHELQSAEYCAVDISVELVSDQAMTELLDFYSTLENHGDDTDGQKIAHATLYRGEISTLDELDEAAPEEGIYASDDGSQIVQVADCASSPQDDEADITLGFSYPGTRNSLGGSHENYQDFVTANLAVMTDGSVSVASADTGDWMRDSSGNWFQTIHPDSRPDVSRVLNIATRYRSASGCFSDCGCRDTGSSSLRSQAESPFNVANFDRNVHVIIEVPTPEDPGESGVVRPLKEIGVCF